MPDLVPGFSPEEFRPPVILRDARGNPITEGFYFKQEEKERVLCYVHEVLGDMWEVEALTLTHHCLRPKGTSHLVPCDYMKYLSEKTNELNALTHFIRDNLSKKQSQLEQSAQTSPKCTEDEELNSQPIKKDGSPKSPYRRDSS